MTTKKPLGVDGGAGALPGVAADCHLRAGEGCARASFATRRGTGRASGLLPVGSRRPP